MKKAQESVSQIFVYIITIVVIGLIVGFGYYVIKNFMGYSSKVEIADFHTSIKNTVSSNTEYGAEEIKTFSLPSGYKGVCFVQNFPNMFSPADNALLAAAIETGPNAKNLFLVLTDGSYEPIANIGKITADGGVLCTDSVNNKIELRFQGLGDHTQISQYQQ